MVNELQFKLYLSQQIKNEFALIIVTYGKDVYSFVSEYFAFIHATETKLYTSRHYLEDAHYLETEFRYNLEVIREETLESAQAELYEYIDIKYENTKDPYYLNNNFMLKEIPNRKLINLSIQGFFEQEFKFVIEKTICDSLREYLGKASNLPKIKKLKQN